MKKNLSCHHRKYKKYFTISLASLSIIRLCGNATTPATSTSQACPDISPVEPRIIQAKCTQIFALQNQEEVKPSVPKYQLCRTKNSKSQACPNISFVEPRTVQAKLAQILSQSRTVQVRLAQILAPQNQEHYIPGLPKCQPSQKQYKPSLPKQPSQEQYKSGLPKQLCRTKKNSTCQACPNIIVEPRRTV